MGEFSVIIRQQGKDAIAQPVSAGTKETFYESAFVVSLTGHLRRNDLFAKGETAVGFAEPECSVHAITARVSQEAGFGQVEVERWCFARGCV